MQNNVGLKKGRTQMKDCHGTQEYDMSIRHKIYGFGTKDDKLVHKQKCYFLDSNTLHRSDLTI